MKIGFVLDDRLDKPDGVQQYVKLVGAWLSSRGHDVHYLVGHSPAATEKNVHHLSRTVGVRFNRNRMAIPLPARKKAVAALLAHEHFDVLHVQMPYSPLLAGRVVAAADSHTAVVGTFHILPHGLLSSTGTRLLGSFLRRNKRRFDAFLSVSPAAQSFAKTHFGIASEVLSNVVELQRYSAGVPYKKLADKANIVFLGRLVERKGAGHLLVAYDRLVTNHPELAATTRLIICGDGQLRAKLEAQAELLRSKHKTDIVFTGFLQEDEKPRYLASAQIAVFPATGGESFGIVLIEAMAAGAQVVVGGDNPGYASVLGSIPDALVPPTKPDQFAARLYSILSEPQRAATMHALQQSLVQHYDIAHVGPQLEAFYERALAKREQKRDT